VTAQIVTVQNMTVQNITVQNRRSHLMWSLIMLSFC
jgi:hypothetical protein